MKTTGRWGVAYRLFSLFLGGIVLLASPVAAKEMQGRLGLGYNSEFSNAYAAGYRLPGVSVKYGLSRDLALEGVVAVATTSPMNSTTGIKFFKNIFYENCLNFYFMLGLGLINLKSQSGIEVLSGFGAEFFIPGVESLGLAVETGATFNNSTGSYALSTLGVSFLDAGIHFYF